MKRFQIAGNLLKSLLLVGMLTACNNDQMVNPTGTAGVEANDRNARVSSLLKLNKIDNHNIQYVKSGKFFGRILRFNHTFNGVDYYTEYTYDDNNPANILWISAKTYDKATKQPVGVETKHQVSNGHCVASSTIAGFSTYSYEYKYNALGLLEEIKQLPPNAGSWISKKFSYIFNPATSTYRLDKISSYSAKGLVTENKYTYSSKKDNYLLNPSDDQTIPLDTYLPIYGYFSDALAESVEHSNVNSGVNNYYKIDYLFNSDGFVISRTRELHPFGKGSNINVSTSTSTFQYSTNWQGIP
jgi:hypothetical protein